MWNVLLLLLGSPSAAAVRAVMFGTCLASFFWREGGGLLISEIGRGCLLFHAVKPSLAGYLWL